MKVFKNRIEDIRKGADRIVRGELGGCSTHALETVGGPAGKELGLQRTLDRASKSSVNKIISWSPQMPYSGLC